MGGLFDGILTCGVCGSTLLPLARNSYRCQNCFQHTVDDSELVSEITSDIHRQTSVLKTLPAELAQLRKEESSFHADIKRAIINDDPDETITEIQRRRAEIERQIRFAKNTLKRARRVAQTPASASYEDVRALVERISVHNNNRIQVTYKKG